MNKSAGAVFDTFLLFFGGYGSSTLSAAQQNGAAEPDPQLSLRKGRNKANELR